MRTILWFLIAITISSAAFGNEAEFQGVSYSLLLDDTTLMADGDVLELIFTTYDGDVAALPYFFDEPNGTIYYSRELKKVASAYLTDFYLLGGEYIWDWGEVHLNLGPNDSDGNGIDDVCEKDQSFHNAVTGQWVSYDGTYGPIGGSLSKNAGAQVGHYHLTLYNTWIGNLVVAGDFYTGTVNGNVVYSRADGSITINYQTTLDTTSPPTSLISTYAIIDQDRIQIQAVDFLPDTVLHRQGDTYTADVTLEDGEDSTFWPDYQKWRIAIKDTNDTDGDGIPDISDEVDNRRMVKLPFLPLLLD